MGSEYKKKSSYLEAHIEILKTKRAFCLKMSIIVLEVMILKTRSSKGLKSTRVISSVRASMAFEGLKPSAHAQTIGKQYLEDKISSREAVARIKARHASKFGR
ncbi:hypothetical protein JCM15765_16590 [Paradesulfitobacterium aromaticivorans]